MWLDISVPPGAMIWPLKSALKHSPNNTPVMAIAMLHGMLKNEGLEVNRKRTYRIYRQLHLQVRTQRPKKLHRLRIPMPVPDGINHCWSVDWICDQFASGRQFRVFNVVDDVSREGVVQITDFSISRGAE